MSEPFQYKSRPVVRSGKTIYYGSMTKPYVVMMNIMSEKKDHNLSVASSIKCYLMKTSQGIEPQDAITKSAERTTLYDALELAAAWLRGVSS